MWYLVSVACLCAGVHGQGAVSTRHRLDSERTINAWTFNNFPNPRTEPTECNRQRPSWICDPDGLLEVKQVDELDLLLGAIRRQSLCPCSVDSCSSNRGGYTISIAIMNKMQRQINDHSTLLADARQFAFGLEKERWTFDRCDEDILIIFSLRDNIVFAVTGMKAREKVNDDRLHEIIMDSMPFFQHNAYMGIKHMVYALRHAILDRYHVYRDEKHHLSQVYSYRKSRPTVEDSSGLHGDGRVVGSYTSGQARAFTLSPLLVLSTLTAIVVKICF